MRVVTPLAIVKLAPSLPHLGAEQRVQSKSGSPFASPSASAHAPCASPRSAPPGAPHTTRSGLSCAGGVQDGGVGVRHRE